jgi:hypothetical protein
VAMLKVFGKYGRYVKKDNKQDHLFWKDGIVIEKDSMLLMVKFDRVEQRIELYPDNHHQNFALQKEVVKFILDIPERQDIEKQEKRLIGEGKTRPKEIYMIGQQFEAEWDEMNWQSGYFKILVSLDGKFFTPWHTIAQQVEQGIFQVQAVEETINEDTKEVVRKVKTISVFDYNKYLPEKDTRQIKKKIFISYSQKDSRFELTNGVKINFKQELEIHLKQLNRLGLSDTWSDTNLLAGEDWDEIIKSELEEADIILFLVSANLIGTDYVWDEEMPLAKFHKQHKKTVLIPVILNPCLWTSIPLFSESNAVPNKGKPVSSYNNREDAYDEITRKIKAVLER